MHPLDRPVPPPESIPLPAFGRPRVTIVIPVHGQPGLTLRCLDSIARTTRTTPYAVVAVDDASPDDTGDLLRRVGELRVHALETNVGYLRAVNAGAAEVRTPYLCLLNNDVEVQPGWLEAMVGRLDTEPNVGLVGARLVDMTTESTLQEAGSIIFSDGTAANYAHGADREAPTVLHPRDVDYCSAAAVVLRTALWHELGGFDERYSPAYYEDVDLAFGVRALGHRVVYEPTAVVHHYGGASHGRDVTSGVKAFQETNRHVFSAKWREELAHQRAPGTCVELARDRDTGPRVVVFDAQVPTPQRDAGSVRAAEIVHGFRRLGASVTLTPVNGELGATSNEHFRRAGIEVIDHPGYVGPAILGLDPDLVVMSRVQVAMACLVTVRQLAPRALLVFDTVDLHHLRVARGAEVDGDPEARQLAASLEELERAMTASCDVTLTVSELERQILLQRDPTADVRVLSLIHSEHPPGPGFAARSGVLFVGNFHHPPNVDAAVHLARDVMPLVRRSLPGLLLVIAGGAPPAEVQELRDECTHVPGWLPDLTEAYGHSRVVIAPLRYGAGVKGKVLDAMARGVPSVVTPVAAEGIGVTEGTHALLGRTAGELAASVVRLHEDRELWCSVSAAARRHVRTYFSRSVADTRLGELLQLAAERRTTWRSVA